MLIFEFLLDPPKKDDRKVIGNFEILFNSIHVPLPSSYLRFTQDASLTELFEILRQSYRIRMEVLRLDCNKLVSFRGKSRTTSWEIWIRTFDIYF